ncbi:hypothetical protein PDESU_00108 [Pontiella desulfatans]|uniref:Uncharacterized protein n=2 Tax=Pontiella desulfatans TaxID=2750659 RepID=A0A6C2TVF9_PONDE|nr:hypothetical protein PDESU_00108 [Pontiella desulfatans]
MIYPLSRTKGEQLRAKLVDTTTRQTRIIEIKDDMKELKLECPDDKWTVLILEKFDPEKQKWIEVHKISRGPQKLN